MKKIRKKILLASPLPPPYSGYEKITQCILRSALTRQFHIIHVNTSNSRSTAHRGGVDTGNILMTIRRMAALVGALVVHRPAVANIPIARNRTGFWKYSSFILAAVLFRCRIVSRLGGADFDRFYGQSSSLFQWYIRFVLNRIDILIVRADRLKEQFRNLVEPPKLRTVYPGLDLTEMDHNVTDISASNELRSFSDNPEKGVNVLFLGYISKAKGALDLLQAAVAVVKCNPAVRFTVAGPMIGREKNIVHLDNPLDTGIEVKKIFAENNLRSHVQLPGEVTGRRKTALFREADMFVLPSYSEGFPFVVLEAMAAGLPLITTRVGALPEVLEAGQNVLFVKTGAPDDLAQKILALAEDPERRRKMGAANRRLVEKKFNLNCFARQMEKIYDAV